MGLPGDADVAELVDALDLGSSAERRGGSSPFIRTTLRSDELRAAAHPKMSVRRAFPKPWQGRAGVINSWRRKQGTYAPGDNPAFAYPMPLK